MLYKEDKVKEAIETFFKEDEISRQITRLSYRPDYMDYQIVLDGTHHCELREKLFQIHFSNVDKGGDAKREIKYLLQNAMEYEDWEKEDEAAGQGRQAIPDPDGKIGVDDDMY